MNVAIAGCGGIGSYLAQHLDRLIELNQIKGSFTFYDDDTVELKNIMYQNFKPSDIDQKKTEALSLRYFNVNFIPKRLSIDAMKEVDLVLLCVDNNPTRRDTWQNFLENGVKFIDSRANGKVFGLFSSDTTNYLDTLGQSNEPSSCQNPFQIAKKEIEFGNVIVAALMAQATLNFFRTKRLPSNLMIAM